MTVYNVHESTDSIAKYCDTRIRLEHCVCVCVSVCVCVTVCVCVCREASTNKVYIQSLQSLSKQVSPSQQAIMDYIWDR